MARRKTKNQTGLPRIEGIPYHDAWAGFVCLNCKTQGYEKIGLKLLTPKEAVEDAEWLCKNCGFVHSHESDLPFEHWPENHRLAESSVATRFWEGFFRSATENPSSHYKQCNTCGRILPFKDFSKHSLWGPLERQMECRSCKGGINAVLNPLRTKQQLHESSVRRRIADLLVEGENEFIDIEDLFKRFGGKCFKTGVVLDINDRRSWEIDHTLPSKYLYPLKISNATLLSKVANGNKKGQWPSEYYTNGELISLAKITGADLQILSSDKPIVNTNIDVNKCVGRYLRVREDSHLPKRIDELKKIIADYKLEGELTKENKQLLGL